MIKIGLTGGLGSGKTIVTSLFQVLNIPVYIADEESKKLTDSSATIRHELIQLFGESIYSDQGLDRPLLASHIFEDANKLQQVNAIIHPEVARHFEAWTKHLFAEICVIESAILFESGFDRIVDVSLMVYAPMQLRIDRALERDPAITREAVIQRIENQMPDEDKKKLSDFLIINDNKHALIPQIHSFLKNIFPTN